MKLLIISLFLFITLGCNESKLIRITGTEEGSDLLINKVNEVIVDVYYEPGVEPYTGAISSEIDTWDITEQNLKRIYENKKAAGRIFVPSQLSEMTQIPSQGKSLWSTQDLYDLSEEYLTNTQSVDRAIFVILYVNGFLTENGQTAKTGTVGISIGSSRVIAIFKDSINLSGESDQVKRFMEQSTLVHEIGHAIGLVNRGIRLTTEHQDEAHGSHCTNPDCVMFWLNEGSADLANFVDNYLATNSVIIFGQECVDDIRLFNP